MATFDVCKRFLVLGKVLFPMELLYLKGVWKKITTTTLSVYCTGSLTISGQNDGIAKQTGSEQEYHCNSGETVVLWSTSCLHQGRDETHSWVHQVLRLHR